MKESRIFTKAELKLLDERISGLRKDPCGIYASRVKPKIRELLEIWFPKKRTLEKLINPKQSKHKEG